METALYNPVKAFLEAQGFTVKGEIRGCDVVALRAGEPDLLVITELKLGLSMELLLQAADRMAIADEVWLAIPATRKGRDQDRRAHVLCRLLGVGLMTVTLSTGRVAVLASHHGSVSLTNTRGADPQRQLAAALTALLHRHPCVVAWLVGHRHLHEIRPHPGPLGGFWEISTGSLIDWPSQTRAVEMLRHGNGPLEIVCTLQDHAAPAGSLAHWHRELARRFAGIRAAGMGGRPEDGTTHLLRP